MKDVRKEHPDMPRLIVGNQRFSLGLITATPRALHALREATTTSRELLARHATGDWGYVHRDDVGLNETALIDGDKISSMYPLKTGEAIWIVTNEDRSETTLMHVDDL